ncbi:MAG: HDIG domain-containing protein [Clostridiales bacterium]|jgi:putative nucleotidyltransferase with HDIG domain|nr:HDIG domain-containing protein [Clostridiales bacterium]
MTVTEFAKGRLMAANRKHIEKSEDHFDFWEQHIRIVVKEALILADLYGADKEIVELGALLHDIALVSDFGKRNEHHKNGAAITYGILSEYGYPDDRKSHVMGCVFNHRSSKNAENIEELCVGDADIISHYYNIPMCFTEAFKRGKIKTGSVDEWVRYFEDDWNDMSERTKKIFKPKYDNIMDVLFGALI